MGPKIPNTGADFQKAIDELFELPEVEEEKKDAQKEDEGEGDKKAEG